MTALYLAVISSAHRSTRNAAYLVMNSVIWGSSPNLVLGLVSCKESCTMTVSVGGSLQANNQTFTVCAQLYYYSRAVGIPQATHVKFFCLIKFHFAKVAEMTGN